MSRGKNIFHNQRIVKRGTLYQAPSDPDFAQRIAGQAYTLTRWRGDSRMWDKYWPKIYKAIVDDPQSMLCNHGEFCRELLYALPDVSKDSYFSNHYPLTKDIANALIQGLKKVPHAASSTAVSWWSSLPGVYEMGYSSELIEFIDQLSIAEQSRKTKGRLPKWLLTTHLNLIRHPELKLSDLPELIQSRKKAESHWGLTNPNNDNPQEVFSADSFDFLSSVILAKNSMDQWRMDELDQASFQSLLTWAKSSNQFWVPPSTNPSETELMRSAGMRLLALSYSAFSWNDDKLVGEILEAFNPLLSAR